MINLENTVLLDVPIYFDVEKVWDDIKPKNHIWEKYEGHPIADCIFMWFEFKNKEQKEDYLNWLKANGKEYKDDLLGGLEKPHTWVRENVSFYPQKKLVASIIDQTGLEGDINTFYPQ